VAHWAHSTGRTAGRGPAALGEGQSLPVEGLVEGCLGLLLGHRAAALQRHTGEEHFFVESDAPSANEDHAGDGSYEGLLQVVDDDGGHAVQRRVDAPQRAAQQPLCLLDNRVTKVNVDQVVTTLGASASKVIGRCTPGLRRVSSPRTVSCQPEVRVGSSNTSASVS
jgi:hypothetical protein